MIIGIFHRTRPCEVFIDGIPLRMGPSLQYMKFATFGFRWGTPNGGAIQLAFALLLHVCGADDAMKYHQMFESDVISNLPLGEDKSFILWEEDIKNFVTRKKAIRKSKWGRLYWKLFGKFHFSENFYKEYVKTNMHYEDWWGLRPSIYFGLLKRIPLEIN
jgi:hypothetical protein